MVCNKTAETLLNKYNDQTLVTFDFLSPFSNSPEVSLHVDYTVYTEYYDHMS